MSVLAGSRHLGDDDLIRYMDHQLDRDGQRLMGAHLRTCADCTGRLEGFRQKSALAKEWLSLLPAEMPDPNKRAVALAALDRTRFRRRSVPMASAWMKAAAAVVLLVSVGMATEPMREFVARGVVRLGGGEPGSAARRLVEWLGQEKQLQKPELARARPLPAAAPESYGYSAEQRPATAAAPTATRAPRPAERPVPPKRGVSPPITFTPAGPDVSLVFSSVQAAGSATIWIRQVPRANVQAVRGYRNEELVTGADGLEVRNRPGSRADYVITIPTRYRYILVKVADGPEVRIGITKSKREWVWTIGLQNSALDQQVPPEEP
jgi:hypothetical protein